MVCHILIKIYFRLTEFRVQGQCIISTEGKGDDAPTTLVPMNITLMTAKQAIYKSNVKSFEMN